MGTVGSIQVIGDQTLGNALFTNKLAVPVNQRSYKWESEHVKQLAEDLSATIASPSESEYFLGSIVLTRGDSGTRPHVVDGQQRLATTMILLAAIRDYFFSNGDVDRAQDIQRDYLLNRDLETQEWEPKFTLNEADDEYFRCRVLLNPNDPQRLTAMAAKLDMAPASHSRINNAAKLMAAHVASIVKPYSTSEKTVRLLEWVNFIRTGARVIWVIVPDEANAFVMFETLNDRGLELSKADLVKNYIFGRSADRIKEVQTRWHNMIGAIETVGGEALTLTYIRHLWSSMYGPTRDRVLFSAIKDKVKSKQAAIDLASALSGNAQTYAAIVTPSHELWDSYPPAASKCISTLRLLEMEQVRPLLLPLIDKMEKNDAVKCLRLLVCCSVRLLIVGGLGGGVMEKFYSECGQAVRKGTIKTPHQLLKQLKTKVAGDEQFRIDFSLATIKQSVLARYYLRALQQQVDGEAQPEYVPNDDQGEITLEHVLPQSPAKNWAHISEDVLNAWTRRIGNLALLKKNQNALADNDDIKTKSKILATSKFSLTSEFKSVTKWGTAEIEARQKRLAAIAVDT
ncbi:MAG TPA: DUF262 domain-containing protein, partial [Pyrinomonadaceae bacterium]|nr:DUF262 domain-containing protein [Pyrinomonadaceae bacterium]